MRCKRSARGPDRLIAELAGRQHGVVTRAQLQGLGLGAGAIDRRLRLGRLHLLHRAVYLVGHRAATREAAWMAAVLAGGDGAALSHFAAAAHWGIRKSARAGIDVTAPRKRRSRHGIVFHTASLPRDEITTHDGIPVTTVPRTIFDLASVTDLRTVERAINEAEILRLWDGLSLDDLLDRYRRRSGSVNARAALHRRRAGATFTRSDLEELFLEVAGRAGLPRPETNVWIEGFEVDCVWREQRLVVEVDSWEIHRTRAAFERDRERSRVLQAAGWHCVAVTHRQLSEGAGEIAADVLRLLAGTTLVA